jgi:hypothetical protein
MRRTLLGVGEHPHVICGPVQVLARQLEDRIAICGLKRIPESLLFVIRLELDDVDSQNARRREVNGNPAHGLVDSNARRGIEIEADENISRRNDEQALRRSEKRVLVFDDVTNTRFGGDELRYGVEAVDDCGLIDARRAALAKCRQRSAERPPAD